MQLFTYIERRAEYHRAQSAARQISSHEIVEYKESQ